jgi:hypothetical protein
MFFKFICYEHNHLQVDSSLVLLKPYHLPPSILFFFIENQIWSLAYSLTTGDVTSVISMFSWVHIYEYIYEINRYSIFFCISEYGIFLTLLICVSLKHCRKYQLLQPGMILNSYLRTAKSLGTGKCQPSFQHHKSCLPHYLHSWRTSIVDWKTMNIY